jgi:hypothetical protein
MNLMVPKRARYYLKNEKLLSFKKLRCTELVINSQSVFVWILQTSLASSNWPLDVSQYNDKPIQVLSQSNCVVRIMKHF